MFDLLLTLLTGQAGAAVRRYARLAGFAAVALLLAAVALVAGAAAAYMALAEAVGPIRAALIVAGACAVLAGLVSVPLWRKPAPPPPSTVATLAELAIAVGLGALAKRGEKKEG